MMLVKIFWLTGASIFLFLGSLHLYYTFFTNKFSTKNKNAEIEMKNTHPLLTKDTTIWKAWIGFNASHSSGVIFIGLINIILVLQYFPVIQNSVLLHLLNIITTVFYCWLGKKYWFRIPFTGILVSAFCFLAAAFLTYLG
jgi:hypothetical protein